MRPCAERRPRRVREVSRRRQEEARKRLYLVETTYYQELARFKKEAGALRQEADHAWEEVRRLRTAWERLREEFE